MHCITSLNGSQPNCTMFGRLLGWYTVLFRWLLPCYGIFQVQNSLCVQGLRSPILAALQHGTRVVGVRQTAALSRGRHLYSARRPSRWALAHILASINLPFYRCRYGLCNQSVDASNVVIFECRCLLNLYNFDRLKIAFSDAFRVLLKCS